MYMHAYTHTHIHIHMHMHSGEHLPKVGGEGRCMHMHARMRMGIRMGHLPKVWGEGDGEAAVAAVELAQISRHLLGAPASGKVGSGQGR